MIQKKQNLLKNERFNTKGIIYGNKQNKAYKTILKLTGVENQQNIILKENIRNQLGKQFKLNLCKKTFDLNKADVIREHNDLDNSDFELKNLVVVLHRFHMFSINSIAASLNLEREKVLLIISEYKKVVKQHTCT